MYLLAYFLQSPADFGFAQLADFVAEFGNDLRFDGQAVAIPAGDVGGVEAGHCFVADDDILEDLVDDVAHVDIAVGVGRAVVKDI